MAQAIVVTLEKALADAFDAYAKGKTGRALAREADRIDRAARAAKVAALTSFLSENPAALIEQLKEDGFDPSKMRLPPERWFDPREGLTSVRALIEQVAANLNDFKQPNPILRDLRAIEPVLVAAQQAGVRFHFTKTDL